ncbi:similar to beta-lactamase family protein [Plenodomus lingam JN3]|uniref:Similar to beta-lactamase family protein n=1 Tax=Leptosphaeria maculans (strain JN3 / isolate v23.1.3 / race Av1-4-5-6-7-8) TaxID=985895 RepID=E5AF88_LEPMJ|nr:similar to beta-lactamase family protein [Plenodomus lingam JN3]CBY01877.1 similar to beta-lactamase family protein [Plenodomus lingam JN3]
MPDYGASSRCLWNVHNVWRTLRIKVFVALTCKENWIHAWEIYGPDDKLLSVPVHACIHPVMRAPCCTKSGLLALTCLPMAIAAPNCPLMGPEFPPPQRLSQHPIWQNALNNITAVLEYMDNGNIANTDAFSYSIQVFSTNPGKPILWERHKTAKNLPTENLGVKKVDGNTVYRLGSVSKVITVLAFLAEVGDSYWNIPVSDVIPELAKYSGQSTLPGFDRLRKTSWDDVTIGSLAAQTSGIERDYGVLGELTETEDVPEKWLGGFPILSASALPPCGTWPLCSRAEFFKGLENMFPSYSPWQTATYSNIGYQLFSYALESLTKRKFVDILDDKIIKPLGLKRTYYENAPVSVGIIPGTLEDTYWNAHLGDASPGGNMYSSPNDLSAMGRAILSSKLIRPSLTRRWLNPVTFTSDFAAAVGAPWGVRRIQLAKDTQPHRTLSVFTKAGSFRQYTSFLTLLRDFQLGFTIMVAGKPALNNFLGADLLGASLIPAYDAVARDEADKLYSGIYVGRETADTDPATRSWLTISTDPNKPGLGVDNWISKGTDMIEMAIKLQSGVDQKPLRPETRLYYTQLESQTAEGGKDQAWKAVFEDTGGPTSRRQPFSTDCGSWVGITGITYGSMPLDEFVFNFDSVGNV